MILSLIHLNKNPSKNKNFTNQEIWDFQSAPLKVDGKIMDWNGDEKHRGYKENCKLILLLLLLLLQKGRLYWEIDGHLEEHGQAFTSPFISIRCLSLFSLT
jgi:hypothetical protein